MVGGEVAARSALFLILSRPSAIIAAKSAKPIFEGPGQTKAAGSGGRV
jgi:hypothetical protein